MGRFAMIAFCENGHVVEEPSFFDLWFTRNHYAVCPKCGADNDGFTLVKSQDVNPWWKPTKWVPVGKSR